VSYRLSSKRTRHLVVLGKAGRFLSIPDHFGPFLVSTTDAHEVYFRADRAWFYIVLLSIGYMVSRGLARAGSRQHDDALSTCGEAPTPSRVWPPPGCSAQASTNTNVTTGRPPPLLAHADVATCASHPT